MDNITTFAENHYPELYTVPEQKMTPSYASDGHWYSESDKGSHQSHSRGRQRKNWTRTPKKFWFED